jgi:two-component system sensor histidine kinase KdpD
MAQELRRKTPEELMRQVQAEEEALTPKGHLKIFLGYSSGVGKTYRMLDEARRRRERGQDIIEAPFSPKCPGKPRRFCRSWR